VKHYFVEQDQTPGDPVASLRQSYEYLRNTTLGPIDNRPHLKKAPQWGLPK
jgi:hypothetical protein